MCTIAVPISTVLWARGEDGNDARRNLAELNHGSTYRWNPSPQWLFEVLLSARARWATAFMTTPSTELDSRFSEPEAEPTSWPDTLAAIKEAEIFWISTVRGDGRPHITPLVAVWLDDSLHFSTGADEQKALNLANNPRVALLTGANDWQRLDVVVEGKAVRVTARDQLQRLSAAWAQKWYGRWRYSVVGDGRRHEGGTALVFAVRPAKVLAFAKGSFSHTWHRFRAS